MAITHSHARGVGGNGKSEMTMEQFKQWLKRFDADNDGRISKGELQEAIKATGGWFAWLTSRSGLKSADANNDGFIDESEMEKLRDFAEKHLNIKIRKN